MRRTFVDILKNKKVDIRTEYSRLYSLFYETKTLGQPIKSIFNRYFCDIWFRGTCTTLDEFDEEFGFNFVKQPEDFNIDYLVSFCEYIYNLSVSFDRDSSIFYNMDMQFLQMQIFGILDKIEYTNIEQEGHVIFVPEKPEAIYVAEVVSESLSNKILEYNHHSLQNNLEGKKEILLKIADELEPHRNELSNLDSSLESNIFYAFNKFNIRHNNCNPKAKSKYIAQFALLSQEEKEELYDWTYNQSLIAFIKLENAGLNEKFKEIKNKIDNNILE